jgi:hypothetical protein
MKMKRCIHAGYLGQSPVFGAIRLELATIMEPVRALDARATQSVP